MFPNPARLSVLSCLALILLLNLGLSGCRAPAPETTLRVMTFNVRFANADDGENRWERRRDMVFDVLRDGEADLIGLQEVLAPQAEEIQAALPEYGFIGAGRTDGANRGEFVPILYRLDRVVLLKSGHFWLSEAPDKPGSIGWDAELPRMATWALFELPAVPPAQPRRVALLNTHFSHRGVRARLYSAQLVRAWVRSQQPAATVVTGDFNAGPDSLPYDTLVKAEAAAGGLRDPFVVLDSPDLASGTYHAFAGVAAGERIDWILHGLRLEPVDVEIVRTSRGDRFPSDHFPVLATLRLRGEE